MSNLCNQRKHSMQPKSIFSESFDNGQKVAGDVLGEVKKKDVVFLKKLEEMGCNLQLNESLKKLVGITDDLEIAI